MSVAQGMIALAQALHTLNKGQPKLNRDKYTSLKTRKRNVENWWDSLTYENKIDVGSAALHFDLMTANYKWKYQSRENDGGSLFSDLTKSQQIIIKTVFSKRNDKYSVIDFASTMIRSIKD